MTVKIFIAYSHLNKEYLAKDSLLGHLRGLESDGLAKFWYDEHLATGDMWNEEIRTRITESHIALCLVSEMFLTSKYVMTKELPLFLQRRKENGLIVFPVILSECDWTDHEWLKSTKFLPSDGKTIEGDYLGTNAEKKIFMNIKRDLKIQLQRIGKKVPPMMNVRTRPTSEQPVRVEPRSRDTSGREDWQNPFALITANDLDHEELIQLFVGDYTDFNTIEKHFDTLIEGQRGTGKTMVLRYMEFDTQIALWVKDKRGDPSLFFEDRSKYVGVYCRLEQGVFDRSDLDNVTDELRKQLLFEHRVALFCLANILRVMDSIIKYRPIPPDGIENMQRRLSALLMDEEIRSCEDWEDTYEFTQATIDVRIMEGDLHLGSLMPGGTPTSFNPFLSLSGQILPFLEWLQTFLKIRCPFFLMIDDFDVLRPSQQLSLFKTASARNLKVACFKFGIMTLGKKIVLSGTDRTYREGDDYDYVELDWIDSGLQTDYKKAVELINSRRLASKQWPSDPPFSKLLDDWQHGFIVRDEVKASMREEWEGLDTRKRPTSFESFWSKYGNARYFQEIARRKTRHRYAGYDAAIDISSGIYRQYLEICNKVIARALAKGWRPDSGERVSAEVQNDAIRKYSGDMINSLLVTAGDTTALLSGDITVTSKHMVTFVNSLTGLFKARLMSNSREPEVFAIAITDALVSNPFAKAILDVALRESILHRRSIDYPPKSSGGPRLPTYVLNRRLAPHLGLGVRMQGRVEMPVSSIELAARDTGAFLNEYATTSDDEGQKQMFDGL